MLGIVSRGFNVKLALQQLTRLVSVNPMQRRNIAELLGNAPLQSKRKPAIIMRQLDLLGV